MEDLLLDVLKENQGKNETLFESSTMNICYKTGIAPLDYALGYSVNVHNCFNCAFCKLDTHFKISLFNWASHPSLIKVISV